MRKNNIKDFAIRFILLLFLHLLLYVNFTYVMTDKITEDEYASISALYSGINVRENLRSDFYVDTEIRYLDRSVVETNLIEDSIIYMYGVAESSAKLLLDGRSSDYVFSFVNRCDLVFDWVDYTAFCEDLYYGCRYFALEGKVDETALNNLMSFYYDIVLEQQENLIPRQAERNKILYSLLISFIGFNLIWWVAGSEKKKSNDV